LNKLYPRPLRATGNHGVTDRSLL